MLELGEEKNHPRACISMCPQNREHGQNPPEKPHPTTHPRMASLLAAQQMGGLRKVLATGQPLEAFLIS